MTINRVPLLFLNVLVIATCGLVYELIAGTLASYVLGDSVTQFSICIGVYLFALGVGAWLSGFVERGLARKFIEIEMAVALLGGFSAPLLFLSFANLSYFHVILYGMVFGIGLLVGLELPLLMRILRSSIEFKDLVARVLTFDYVGALAGSLLFPIFLVPHLGLVRTSLLFGILNGLVGFWGTWILASSVPRGITLLRFRGVVVLLALTIAIIKADAFTELSEDKLYSNPIVYATTSKYQRIVVTQGSGGFQLYLDGNLQLSSADEYRYHEALVHPAMVAAGQPRQVLVLGGGDGLAVREILRYPHVEHVVLVDLDPEMTSLSDRFPPLGKLNQHSLKDPKVEIVNDDALIWIEQSQQQFDAVIVDFPDPNNFSLGKLYTQRFYKLLKQRLTPRASVGIQCTSPHYARTSYWCIIQTMEAAGLFVQPYQVPVPSFGIWGFAVARQEAFPPPVQVPADLRYLTPESAGQMFVMPKDIRRVPTEINRLDNQQLVRYYRSDHDSWSSRGIE